MPEKPCDDQSTARRASVIIINYNSLEDTLACLASLQDSIGAEDEVIVVDNSSRDGEAARIEAAYPWVQLLRSATNLGFGGGNNLGARTASGEYLAFLNPDTSVEPGWLDALIAAAGSFPQVSLVTPKILLLQDRNHINTCGNDIHLSGLTLCRGLGRLHKAFRTLEEVSAVSGAAFVMRKALFEQLGGFDETFFMYLEDTDLSLRARLAGAACLCVPQATVYHKYAAQFDAHKIFYLERNRYLMLLKVFRWPTIALLLPALFLAEVVSWGFALMHGNGRSKLRTYPWLFKHWRLIRARRRATQASRQISDRRILALHSANLDFQQTGRGAASKAATLIFNPLFRFTAWTLRGLIWW